MILNMTMQEFSTEIKISVDNLIQKFSDIGIIKNRSDFITNTERELLFKYMKSDENEKFNKLSLQRKIRSTLNISSIGGKNKQVQIEVRKKRIYMIPRASYTQESEDVSIKKSKKRESLCDKDKLINECVRNRLIKSDLDNEKAFSVKNMPLDTNMFEKRDDCNVKKLEIRNLVEESKAYYKINDKSQQLLYDKKNLKKVQDFSNYYSNDSLVRIETKKSKSGNSLEHDITRASLTKTKGIHHSTTLKLKTEHRNHQVTRTRFRSKSLGKMAKHKRNNSRLYVSISNDSDRENDLYIIPNKLYKSKRKQSTLIQSFNKPVQTISRDIVIGKTISVLELSNKMSVKSSDMIKVMMKLGVMATINQILDQETAQLVIEEMGHNAVLRRENELEELIMQDYRSNVKSVTDNFKNNILYKNRAPIVTIMGHVDHGKTSLLDYIRSSKTASFELGGITQSIGAYSVSTMNGMITFLDTPGHEAFTSMRVRGVHLTDIVVLVVAADDGVMPQTIEAIKYVQSANIPIIVAINKVDKLDINIDQVKYQLNRYGLIPEEWGGNTQFINVSAISGIGINNLLDSILLQSEALELKVMHYGAAKAIVIESLLDKSRGPIVIVLVREGELKCGDIVLCGTEYGRVRAIYDEFGGDIVKAVPSMPVKILGLSGTPDSGEMMIVVSSEKKAREVALYRQEKRREIKLALKQEENTSVSENFFDNVHEVIKFVELNLIIKADTQGSVEAICESLKKLSNDKIMIKILSSSVGNITETDSVLAVASNAIILGFNVKSDASVRRFVESNRLDIRYYSVIYALLDEVKKIMYTALTPKYTERIMGIAEVRNVFRSLKYGNIAGCIVTQGIIKSYRKIKLIRNKIVIYQGELESLRHFKDNVDEVKVGMECGIGIKNCNDICAGDVIEVLDISE